MSVSTNFQSNSEFAAAVSTIAKARNTMQLAVAIKAKLRKSGEDGAYPDLHYMSSEINTAEEAVSTVVKNKFPRYTAECIKKVVNFAPRAEEIIAFLDQINDQFPLVRQKIEAENAAKKAKKAQQAAEREWEAKKVHSQKWNALSADYTSRRTFSGQDDEDYC
ncbi:hypothetical protein IJJ37_02905 [Candidatus Saccharibacteria bacterium]|nr:hypothetical protein [Candidatus Saccharibacteria bacterium]